MGNRICSPFYYLATKCYILKVQIIELRYIILNHDILESYAKRIPFEVRATLRGLDDDSRLGLVVAMLDDGKMTFNEMKTKFEMNSSSLSNHLSILQEGNLIQNFYEKNNNRVSSYYDVTDIAESMLYACCYLLGGCD